jgi:hypothetical protein
MENKKPSEIVPMVDARLVIELMDAFEEQIELLSSEIPIHSVKRQVIEEGLRKTRALISLCREEVARVQKEASPEQGSAQ